MGWGVRCTTLASNFTTSAITVAGVRGLCQVGAPRWPVVEATIAGMHQAMLEGKLNCTDLVQAYMQRIYSFDQQTSLNAVREVSATANDSAARMDIQLAQARRSGGALPPLFCVPVLVKDNIDTVGMVATAGSIALLDNFPQRDAQPVQRIREAGGIVLAKANMGEWAFSPLFSVSSAAGVVRNPYDTDRVPAGSSGGVAAGVSANLGMVGLGTDTGNSVRGPAAHCGLVGFRPSLGLSSRIGLIPLDNTSDVAGPLTRSVEDAARLFGVLAGFDPRDPLTRFSLNASLPDNYTQFLDAGGLKGAKIGVMRQMIDNATADPEMLALFQRALDAMAGAGATIYEDFRIRGNSLGERDWDGRTNAWYTGFGAGGKWEDLNCVAHFRFDVDAYLANSGSRYKTVEAIVADGLYHPAINDSIASRMAVSEPPEKYPTADLRAEGAVCGCTDFYQNPCRAEFRKRLIESMHSAGLDVIVYPTWSNVARLVGDYSTPDGNDSPQIPPPTGAPAIVVPMGFTNGTSHQPLPASLQIVARPFDEARMFRVAYAFEQLTHLRRPPGLYPECTAAGSASAPFPLRRVTHLCAPGMRTMWVLAAAVLATASVASAAASDDILGRSGRSLSTIRLSPTNVGGTGKYPNATLTVELPTGCVPFSVKSTSANSNQQKCPQGCLLTGFDSDTDADKPKAPLIVRVPKGETSRITLKVGRDVNYLTPNKKTIPDDEGFRYTTRNNRAELLARYTVPSDARTGSSVTVVIGHLKRDPNSDVATPDPKLPAPTCLVNITWIVTRSEPDRTETRKAAQAPAADDAFGSTDYATPSSVSTSSDDFGSDSTSTKKVKSSDDSPTPKRTPPNAPTTAPDGFRRRLLSSEDA
ncbi:hypothetical protein WJX81_001352 [Elliptochloris bilobata]|uniref:Amidase domain-containing protein n=1 Tax=Elliptochloris bilobata TaxID=381761 RepID=A0AAW1RGN3_9CHLO